MLERYRHLMLQMCPFQMCVTTTKTFPSLTPLRLLSYSHETTFFHPNSLSSISSLPHTYFLTPTQPLSDSLTPSQLLFHSFSTTFLHLNFFSSTLHSHSTISLLPHSLSSTTSFVTKFFSSSVLLALNHFLAPNSLSTTS
jgi:hypothetical protein